MGADDYLIKPCCSIVLWQKIEYYFFLQMSKAAAVCETHKEAHGLLPHQVLKVTEGEASLAAGNKKYFLDVHNLGEGQVTAETVAHAHEKDLAVQDKFGVTFINYWVDEKNGIVICLSEANESTEVLKTHTKTHGLIPDTIVEVIQGE